MRKIKKYGSIEGVVTEPSGAVLPGATVHLWPDLWPDFECTPIVTKTSDNGSYYFPKVTPGLYRIFCRVQGFEEIGTRQFEVFEDEELVQNLSLEVPTA